MQQQQQGVLASLQQSSGAQSTDMEDTEFDDAEGTPADPVAQEQYEFLRAHAQMAIYNEARWREAFQAIIATPDTAFNAGQVVGLTMYGLVSKAKEDSGADVDGDAIERAGADLLELIYDDLGSAGFVKADATEEQDNEWFERALTAAYGAFEQGRLMGGEVTEEDLQQELQDYLDLVQAGEIAEQP